MHRQLPLGQHRPVTQIHTHAKISNGLLRRLLILSDSQDSNESINAYVGRTTFGVPFFSNMCLRKLGHQHEKNSLETEFLPDKKKVCSGHKMQQKIKN